MSIIFSFLHLPGLVETRCDEVDICSTLYNDYAHGTSIKESSTICHHLYHFLIDLIKNATSVLEQFGFDLYYYQNSPDEHVKGDDSFSLADSHRIHLVLSNDSLAVTCNVQLVQIDLVCSSELEVVTRGGVMHAHNKLLTI